MSARVWLLTAAVIFANAAGNAILAHGMKQAPVAAGLLRPLLHPAVIGGILLLILWTALRIRLLGLADLTFVLPVTATGYVLNVLVGALVFHETVSPQRWAGTLLITAGAALTGLGAHRTEPPR